MNLSTAMDYPKCEDGSMALYINGEKVAQSLIENEIQRLLPSYEEVFQDQPAEDRQRRQQELPARGLVQYSSVAFRPSEFGRHLADQQPKLVAATCHGEVRRTKPEAASEAGSGGNTNATIRNTLPAGRLPRIAPKSLCHKDLQRLAPLSGPTRQRSRFNEVCPPAGVGGLAREQKL